MAESTKTFHRWTPEEDKKLVSAIEREKAAYQTIGQPGGINREVFWGQIPGRIGVLATPLACSMRYRTLTSDTQWAKRRRKEPEKKVESDAKPVTTDDLEVITGDLAVVKEQLAAFTRQIEKLSRLWEPLAR